MKQDDSSAAQLFWCNCAEFHENPWVCGIFYWGPTVLSDPPPRTASDLGDCYPPWPSSFLDKRLNLRDSSYLGQPHNEIVKYLAR